MLYDEEKDYVMRMIREVSRVLFSILFGKQYVQVETELENKFRTEGTPENALKDLVVRGQICEAENILLEDLDYSNKASVAFAVMFYRYLGEMEDGFLQQNLHVCKVRFNQSHYFAKSNTLMLNYTAVVDSMDVHENEEIDSYRWFTREEAAKNVAGSSLAGDFLNGYLTGEYHFSDSIKHSDGEDEKETEKP